MANNGQGIRILIEPELDSAYLYPSPLTHATCAIINDETSQQPRFCRSGEGEGQAARVPLALRRDGRQDRTGAFMTVVWFEI